MIIIAELVLKQCFYMRTGSNIFFFQCNTSQKEQIALSQVPLWLHKILINNCIPGIQSFLVVSFFCSVFSKYYYWCNNYVDKEKNVNRKISLTSQVSGQHIGPNGLILCKIVNMMSQSAT